MSGVQTLVVKSDQEVSIVDVKNFLMQELRGIEGSTVMPAESPVGASAANAVIERSVWEMHSTTRAIVAYAGAQYRVGATQCNFGMVWSSQDKWSAGSKEVFRMERQRF